MSGKPTPAMALEEAWLHSGATSSAAFSEAVFLTLLGDQKLQWTRSIASKQGEKTTLLKEWMAHASHWTHWLSEVANNEGQSLPKEDVWSAIDYALKHGNSYHVEVVVSAWLSARPDVWSQDTDRVQSVFASAVDRNMVKIQKLVEGNERLDVNAKIQREQSSWKETQTLLGSASDPEVIERLLKSGADPFLSVNGGPRAWDEWTKKKNGEYIGSDRQRAFARKLAATTLLPESQNSAEDVWAAFETGATVEEKTTMLKQAAKNGFWSLTSKRIGPTEGATSLMYLASRGELNAKGVLRLVPTKAWLDQDKLGRTPTEYVWAAWAGSEGKTLRKLEGMPALTPTQQASVVWHHMAVKGKVPKTNVCDALLLSPPDVLCNEHSDQGEKNRFWSAFFTNNQSTDRLFDAIWVTPIEDGHRRNDPQSSPKITSLSDLSVWRRSLQEARNPENGVRWIESSKGAANACIALLWQEKTARSHSYQPNLPEAKWDAETEKALTILLDAGGSVRETFRQKDARVTAHKEAVAALPSNVQVHRRSRLEACDSLPRKHGTSSVYGQWQSFGEKWELKTRVESRIGPLISKPSSAL